MKIILATDGSEHSAEAARFLTCLNLSEDDEITVLHVVSWVPFRYDLESYQASLRHIKEEIAPRILDNALQILRPVGARISTAILDGSAERYIVAAAMDTGADMIVLGARGKKAIASLVAGSVTRTVSITSPKPVLVIKPPVCTTPGMKILFAADGSENSLEVGRILSLMPFREDASITILNAIWSDFSNIPERFVLEINDRIKDALAKERSAEFTESEKIIEEAKEVLSRRFGRINALSKVGDPSIEILKTAEDWNADMIAVGCRGLRGIVGAMGSVSRHVLNHSKSSVLIGKSCRE